MITTMTEADWRIVLQVFEASRSRRGDKGREDRRFLEMPKPYSLDLRERVAEAVSAGASRREAAERFEVCPGSAIKWMQRLRDTGSVAAKPSGGSRRMQEAAKGCRRLKAHKQLPALRAALEASATHGALARRSSFI